MSKKPWRVSRKRLAALEAEVEEILAGYDAIHAQPGQRTRADWDAISDLNRRYARTTTLRDNMRFTLWRKKRERDRAAQSDTA